MRMDRRSLLKQFAITGITFGLGMTQTKEAIATPLPSWGYDDNTGPAHWADLSPEYRQCKTGHHQSPVDLSPSDVGRSLDDTVTTIEIHYATPSIALKHTEKTIQGNVNTGNRIILSGEPFELLQFHFHHPSEHSIHGQHFPMEIHFVHANARGELAVLGVFLTTGPENQILTPILEAVPRQPKKAMHIPELQIDLGRLVLGDRPPQAPSNQVPPERLMFRYSGSLTTPPCSEPVQWFVFKDPIPASPAQIDAFKALFPSNARPTQSATADKSAAEFKGYGSRMTRAMFK